MPRPPDHGPPDDGGDRAAERLRQFERARGLPPDEAVDDPDEAVDTGAGEDTGDRECTGTPAPDGPASEDEEDQDA